MNKKHFAHYGFFPMLFAVACAHAQMAGEPAVTFLATDPAPDAQLARNERFYVRFAVNSATPVAVMINAYTKGNPVFADMGSSAVNQLSAGGATAVAHFFYWGAMTRHIDEVRLTVGDPATPGKGREFALPVNLTLLPTDAMTARPQASWVSEWQQSATARLPATSSGGSPIPHLMPIILLAIVAIGIAVTLLFTRRSRPKPGRDSAR